MQWKLSELYPQLQLNSYWSLNENLACKLFAATAEPCLGLNLLLLSHVFIQICFASSHVFAYLQRLRQHLLSK